MTHAFYIIAAYGLAATVLAGLVVCSLREWARVKKQSGKPDA